MISVLTLVLGVSIAVSPDERRHRLRRGSASILNVCYLFGRPWPGRQGRWRRACWKGSWPRLYTVGLDRPIRDVSSAAHRPVRACAGTTMSPMSQKPSYPREEPRRDGAARPEAPRKEAAPRYEQQRRGPAPEPWQREQPPSEQAPAPRRHGEPARERRRRGGWGLGLAVVIGLGIVAALLAAMVLVAREQVLRSQAPPATAPIAVQPVR